MNPERLQELLRQRALVQQQLEWLDREIAATGDAYPPSSPAPAATASRAVSSTPPEVSFPEYQPDPEGARQAARRGCFIMAAIILALLAASLVAIYYWRYRDRPLFLPAARSTQLVVPALARPA